MKVIGVGCGPGLLTEEARRAVEEAESVYGSERAVELAGNPEGAVTIDDWSSLGDLPDEGVLLSTGDPMLSGLGRMGDSVPGISSHQLCCNRLGLRMEKTVPVTGHGDRSGEDAKDTVESFLELGLNVFILPGELTAPEVEKLAADRGFDAVVCERLGYADEAIVEPADEHRRPFSVVTGPDVEAIQR